VRDTQLTEAEFRQLCGLVAKAGQLTTPSHNEVVLAAGSLGVSALVCLLNNGDAANRDHRQPDGAVLAQGIAAHAQRRLHRALAHAGRSGVRHAWVSDRDGQPVADAEVDIWQASGEGYYENQDPGAGRHEPARHLHHRRAGPHRFRTVKPSGYPMPVTARWAQLLRAQGRHNMRPAHIHFLIHKPGFKTQFSQLYSSDDPHLDTDVQFGVTQALVGQYVLHEGEAAPAPDVQGRWYTLEHRFVIAPGDDTLPPPPITAKADGERPPLVVLGRSEGGHRRRGCRKRPASQRTTETP
jgi:hydroxyquinol 1,2-dioxygenase